MSDPLDPNGFPPEALLAEYPLAIAGLAEEIRALVREAVPDSIEAVRPGWRIIGYNVPAGRRRPYFAWLMVQLEHVHLGFPQGVLLEDPDRELEGAGITKRARWLTAVPGRDLVAEPYRRFALQAAHIAGLSPGEQGALRQEREARRAAGGAQVSETEPR
jgi:Domain of unknown function (DU1801)